MGRQFPGSVKLPNLSKSSIVPSDQADGKIPVDIEVQYVQHNTSGIALIVSIQYLVLTSRTELDLFTSTSFT